MKRQTIELENIFVNHTHYNESHSERIKILKITLRKPNLNYK